MSDAYKVMTGCIKVKRVSGIVVFFMLFATLSSIAQTKNSKDSVQILTLDQCIQYALQHQPVLMQSMINLSIVKKNNVIALSQWIPQVNVAGTLTHYNVLPTTFIPNSENPSAPPTPLHIGIYNQADPTIQATETIFNPTVLYAASSAHLYIQVAKQSTDSNKINTIASVSKAFYNLLLTLQQIDALKSDTSELGRSVRDAYHQYVGGIVDQTDYKEAIVSLNNTLVQLRQAQENITPQYATLKQLMGFPPEQQFNVLYDTTQMLQEIAFDTTQQLNYQNRIEFQQIQTDKLLQNKLTNYYRYEFLPNLSAFYDYDYEFESNTFSNLFIKTYPYNYMGLTLSIPIFTGFARLENVQKTKLQGEQINWGEVNLKAGIYQQYATAMANYKSNLYSLHLTQENTKMSRDVYTIVSLQYKQGVVPYLNVITAQTDYITSQIGYLNALFNVLSSKIDLQQSMGLISPNR